jgi:GNAT superfamily N-acetyltransferase
VQAQLELVEAEALASLCESGALPVLRVAGATCTAAPAAPQNTMLNRVTGLGLERPPSESDLDTIDAFFGAHGTRYAVAASPLAAPDLEQRLRARGFADGYAWMKFRRNVDEPPEAPTALHVEQVADGAQFGALVAAAFELPPRIASMFVRLPALAGWHCFVAYDEDEPAAAAALFTDRTVGWLGAAGTRAEFRGRGAQTALLAARIRRARELGLKALATETGERREGRPGGSYRNILRAGFEEAYLRPNLVAPAR